MPNAPHRIVIVDDEGWRMAPLRSLLERTGFEVVVIEEATTAINLFNKEEAFDLLIFDLMMPIPRGVVGTLDALRLLFGTRTGILVYEAWIRIYPTHPAIMLTCVSDYHLNALLLAQQNRGLGKVVPLNKAGVRLMDINDTCRRLLGLIQ